MTSLTNGILVFTALTFLTCTNSADKNKITTDLFKKDVADTLQYLNKFFDYPSQAQGYGGRPSKHLSTTEWFVNEISPEEAKRLLTHENSFIRAAAFRKLCRVRDSELFKVIIDSYSDTLKVYQFAGCSEVQYGLFDFYIKTAGYPFINENNDRLLTRQQKKTIDSLAMTRDFWRDWFKSMPPQPTMNKNEID